jgi:hypothetical protein
MFPRGNSRKERKRMRTLLLALVLFTAAGVAVADELSVKSAEQFPYTPPDRDVIYMQPPHVYWWTINASSPFESWLIDDIPADLYCLEFNDIDFYALEWGGYWQTPVGVTVRIFHTQCPPGDPYDEYYFLWDEVMSELAYEDPGWMTAYYCIVCLPMTYHIHDMMSVGFQLDFDWGANPPYGGTVMTDDYMVFGACEAWWVGDYWGYSGYISGYFGTMADVAYSLSFDNATATQETSWGNVKSLFR